MLEILYGPDRTANSAQLLQQICANAEKKIAGQILIVPEQYSHETERALCAAGGDTISRYAEVLSFTRLAARVFSVCGGVCEEYLDENGRLLTLYLAAQQVREQLKFYASVMTRPEFLKQLGTLMEELLTSCVTPDALQAAAVRLTGRLAQKVTELALLYESYLSVCKTGRGDPVTRQMRLLELLEETDFLDGREVFLDGFSDFTALQQQLIAAILAHAEQVHISVLTDGSERPACQTGNETRRRLLQLAARQQIPVRQTRVPGGACRAEPVQLWLDGLFFGGVGTAQAMEAVALVHADSVQAACSYAARTVRDGVLTGRRCRDFTICMTDAAAYAPTMQTLLERAGLPVYCAGAADVAEKPLIAALLAALQACVRFETEPLLVFLKSAFSPLTQEECDRLEWYVQYWDVCGSVWQRPWQMHPRGLGQPMTPEDEQTLAALNVLRERAVAPLVRLHTGVCGAESTGAQVRAVAALLEEVELAGRLQTQQEQLEASGQAQRAQECGQLYEAVLTTLEQMDRVLGRALLEPELFVQLFTMLLSGSKAATIPSACDAVQLTTPQLLRHRRTPVLLVLGADDGLFPAFSESAGLLADPERQTLRRLGVELSPGREAQMDREMSWVCAALSAAEAQITLVSCAVQPSFLYTRTQRLFPALAEQQAAAQAFFADSTAAACAALRQPQMPDGLPQCVRQRAQALRAHTGYALSAMGPDAVRALYGRTLQLSASKIDRFAGCRYAYFLQYGLQLKPWKQAEFDAPLFGTFVHDVLEHTVRDAQQAGGFASLTDAQVRAIAGRHMDAYLNTYLPQLARQGRREAYLSERNRQEAEAVVLDVARELRQSQFTPVAEELRFAADGGLPPIVYRAECGEGLLSGQIDRVDVYRGAGRPYYRIIDYKTGHKEFDYTELLYGQNLQMLLYLFALQTDGMEGARPAGALYVPGRCDMVKLQPGEDPALADEQRQKALRRKGLVLDDAQVLQAMEPFADGQPQYLPVQRKKDELTGDLVSGGQLQTLERFVTGQVRAMIDEILSGALAPNPVDRGPSKQACQYCDFASVCHKDVCQVTVRRFAAVKAPEFWAEVERRLADG